MSRKSLLGAFGFMGAPSQGEGRRATAAHDVAGCFVADDRQQPEVSVHLQGWRHRDADSRRVWLFVQVRVNGRLAHELALSKADAAPVSLNLLLRNYLCAAPSDERIGNEQTEWLCRAVTERLAGAVSKMDARPWLVKELPKA